MTSNFTCLISVCSFDIHFLFIFWKCDFSSQAIFTATSIPQLWNANWSVQSQGRRLKVISLFTAQLLTLPKFCGHFLIHNNFSFLLFKWLCKNLMISNPKIMMSFPNHLYRRNFLVKRKSTSENGDTFCRGTDNYSYLTITTKLWKCSHKWARILCPLHPVQRIFIFSHSNIFVLTIFMYKSCFFFGHILPCIFARIARDVMRIEKEEGRSKR